MYINVQRERIFLMRKIRGALLAFVVTFMLPVGAWAQSAACGPEKDWPTVTVAGEEWHINIVQDFLFTATVWTGAYKRHCVHFRRLNPGTAGEWKALRGGRADVAISAVVSKILRNKTEVLAVVTGRTLYNLVVKDDAPLGKMVIASYGCGMAGSPGLASTQFRAIPAVRASKLKVRCLSGDETHPEGAIYIRPIPFPGIRANCVISGRCNAVHALPRTAWVLMQRGAKIVFDTTAFNAGGARVPATGIIAMRGWAEKNPVKAKRFLAALTETAMWLHAPENRDRVMVLLAAYRKIIPFRSVKELPAKLPADLPAVKRQEVEYYFSVLFGENSALPRHLCIDPNVVDAGIRFYVSNKKKPVGGLANYNYLPLVPDSCRKKG